MDNALSFHCFIYYQSCFVLVKVADPNILESLSLLEKKAKKSTHVDQQSHKPFAIKMDLFLFKNVSATTSYV